MPLPNYGYHNEETKQNQELIFEMPPKIVDSKDDPKGSKNNRKKAQITTGKLGIELERKMVINNDDPDNVWKSPVVDPDNLESANRYKSETKEIRHDVKKNLDNFISSDKLKEIRSNRNKQDPLNVSAPIITPMNTSKIPTYSNPVKRDPYEVDVPVQRSRDRQVSSRSDSFSSSSPSSFAISSQTYSVQQTRQSINIQPGGTYARAQMNKFRLN
eukprot:TRINITY_DN8461_c0_g1_i1.p1 TRINITY_DN8461_c0_g1~~TRINITY_DN8461_c0_g1_i1.p1  ORF type:complete len:215 (-),score=31.83 TRINITY_DN8461_c0_g1_i1:251-895(-)